MPINTRQFQMRGDESLVSSVDYFLKGDSPMNDYYGSMIAALIERGLDHKINQSYLPKLQKLSTGGINENGKWVLDYYRLEDHFKFENIHSNKFNTDGRIYVNEIEFDEKVKDRDDDKYQDVCTKQVLGRMFMVFENNVEKPHYISFYKSNSIGKWVFIISSSLRKNILSNLKDCDKSILNHIRNNCIKFDLSINIHDAIRMYIQYINDPTSVEIKPIVKDWIANNFSYSFDLSNITFPSYIQLITGYINNEVERVYKNTDTDFSNPLSYSNVSEYIIIDNIALGVYIDSQKTKRIAVKKLDEVKSEL